jgi:hypothetical protein
MLPDGMVNAWIRKVRTTRKRRTAMAKERIHSSGPSFTGSPFDFADDAGAAGRRAVDPFTALFSMRSRLPEAHPRRARAPRGKGAGGAARGGRDTGTRQPGEGPARTIARRGGASTRGSSSATAGMLLAPPGPPGLGSPPRIFRQPPCGSSSSPTPSPATGVTATRTSCAGWCAARSEARSPGHLVRAVAQLVHRQPVRGPRARPILEFARTFPDLDIQIYGAWDGIMEEADRLTRGADLVIVHEFNEPELVGRSRLLRHRRDDFLLLFLDTHHRPVSAPGRPGASTSSTSTACSPTAIRSPGLP